MAILFALIAAVGWGASDYFGGDASRRDTSVFAVVAITELLGFLLLVPVLIARGNAPPANPRLLLAAVAGVAVMVELSLIYRALSHGQAFITAPTGALGTAAAVALGLVLGEPLSLALAIGLVCALLGGGITAWTPAGSGPSRANAGWSAVAVCLAAAVAVATMLTSLRAAGRLDPYWATATEHASTGLSAGIAALVGARRRGVRAIVPRRSELPTLVLVAAVGVSGDIAYTNGSRHGALSIVAAISSLYPVTTVVLGRVLQGQRATLIQVVGIVLALCGTAILGAATG
jgi:drug/metabolite transporter (DMT)-like permease